MYGYCLQVIYNERVYQTLLHEEANKKQKHKNDQTDKSDTHLGILLNLATLVNQSLLPNLTHNYFLSYGFIYLLFCIHFNMNIMCQT